jgi:hypothetical protein
MKTVSYKIFSKLGRSHCTEDTYLKSLIAPSFFTLINWFFYNLLFCKSDVIIESAVFLRIPPSFPIKV